MERKKENGSLVLAQQQLLRPKLLDGTHNNSCCCCCLFDIAIAAAAFKLCIGSALSFSLSLSNRLSPSLVHTPSLSLTHTQRKISLSLSFMQKSYLIGILSSSLSPPPGRSFLLLLLLFSLSLHLGWLQSGTSILDAILHTNFIFVDVSGIVNSFDVSCARRITCM